METFDSIGRYISAISTQSTPEPVIGKRNPTSISENIMRTSSKLAMDPQIFTDAVISMEAFSSSILHLHMFPDEVSTYGDYPNPFRRRWFWPFRK